MRRLALSLILALGLPVLTGCDALGIESTEQVNARKEADGKAIGSACRHASRAIEDCYTLNPKASRPAVFAGWREMDEYMRENKLEGVAPVVPRPGKGASPGATTAEAEPDAEPAKAEPGAAKATRAAKADTGHGEKAKGG